MSEKKLILKPSEMCIQCGEKCNPLFQYCNECIKKPLKAVEKVKEKK